MKDHAAIAAVSKQALHDVSVGIIVKMYKPVVEFWKKPKLRRRNGAAVYKKRPH